MGEERDGHATVRAELTVWEAQAFSLGSVNPPKMKEVRGP